MISDRRMVLIPGEEILKDLAYLSTDLLHPSDDGHIRMGEHLANWIRSYEEGLEGVPYPPRMPPVNSNGKRDRF